jgi:hypothetical protein
METKVSQLFLLTAFLCVVGQPISRAGAQTSSPPAAPSTQPRLAIPEGHAYSGAYVEFGDREDEVTLEGIEHFDGLAHKQQAIVAFSSDWGNQSFPERQLRIVAGYGAVPLVFWSPWDRPLSAAGPPVPRRFNLNAILAGTWNSYIDSWAEQARGFGKPMLVSWGLEMNGTWFPWSGAYYGGGQPVPGCEGCFAGPEKYKQAFRYVVDRVRAHGASNIVWVWHANSESFPNTGWNAMDKYYPGPKYVDWVGISAYGTQYESEDWMSVDRALTSYYRRLCAVDESKPVMLAEWGVAEFPSKGDRAQWLTEFFARLPKDYPRIRAAIYWHERWQNDDQTYSNLRVNSSPEALDAYRQGVASPYWLARPIFDR